MAMNPMQRKANNSFLLGILVTLLITGLIIAFLIFQVSKLNKELEAQEAKKINVYVVADTIKSGESIDDSKLQYIETTLGNVDTSNIVTYIDPEFQKAKVDLNPGTVLTNDLLYEGEALAADVRSQEYNVITLPTQLQTGEYIDIRLRTPEGRDLIVVSHKEVTIPQIFDVDTANCIWVDLSEEEILMMSGAIVEAYKMNGAKLYATRYVEPGMQTAATTTYVPSDEVRALIERDPNIVEEAKQALKNNFSGNSSLVRPGINNAVNNEDATDNVVDKTEEEITNIKEERESYIESLAG